VASFPLSQAPWDNGTTVGVYPAVAVPAGSDVPTGSPVTTGTVSGGSVTFTGLEEQVHYYAYAGGRGVRFMVPRVSAQTPDRTRIEALERAVRPPGSEGPRDDLQDLLDDAAEDAVRLTGVYRITAQLTIPSGARVDAREATFIPSGFNSHVFVGDSPTPRTPTTTYQLTADTVVGAYTVTVSSGDSANFAAGDRVTLRDATYALGGENCRRETNVVKSVNTGTGVITLERPIGHVYAAANDSWIAEITPVTDVHWQGGTFDMSGIAGGIAADCDAVYLDWPENCIVEGITVHDHPDKSVDFHGGIDSVIRDCNAHSPSRDGAGEGYNMRVHYSRDCRIEGGWSRNVRHHADISGGQGCWVRRGKSSGRTSTDQCGAFLHGLEERWCGIEGFQADNMGVGAGAGNGSFGASYDCTVDAHLTGCDTGFFIAQGCSGMKIRGRADESVIRGLAIDNSACDIDVIVDGITTNPSNYGAVNIAGTSDVTGRVRVRNAIYRSINVTSSGTVALDVDVDHPAAATNIPVVGSSLAATSRLTLRGRVVANNAGSAAIAATGNAAAIVTLVRGLEILGTYSARFANTAGAVLIGGARRETEGTAAPAAGTWEQGDRCWNTTPSAGGAPGWVCTTAGTPGTWKAMANLAA
jgi:hypothetical protein